MLIDALRSAPKARYASYGIVPVPFPVNSIGLDDGTGVFGDEIGTILCQGIPGCVPLEAAAHMTKPVGMTIVEEDLQIIPNQEWRLYLSAPGYVGVTDPPSPANPQPANLISFEAVPKGVPSIFVQVPNADHLDFTSDPLYQFFSTVFYGHQRVFEPGNYYTPLDLDFLLDMTAHYSTAFFDLTLKGKRGSLGALKTGRYHNVTADGRDVKVRTNSLETRIQQQTGAPKPKGS